MQTIDLCGDWQFRQKGTKVYTKALVPGCVHTDLLRAKKIPDPFWGANELQLQWIENVDWEYRKVFSVAKSLLHEEIIELVAEGLDTITVIIINGEPVATTESMFFEQRCDIKPFLKPGKNTIEVIFKNPMSYIEAYKEHRLDQEWNDPIGGCSLIRKEQCSFGWDWGPRFATSGIYKPVRIEARSHNKISSIAVIQEHTDGIVTLTCKPELLKPASPDSSIRYSVFLSGELVCESMDSRLNILNPKLWWPNGLGDQPLYTIKAELMESGIVIDTKEQRIGLRTITLERRPDEWGESFYFAVNSVPVFAKGANWIPANSFVSAVSKETYYNLLSSTVNANMNMLRVWGGGIYEYDDFYNLCDELGILIWHDFMFACALYPGHEQFIKLVEQEADFQTKRLRNHACMALWCGNNEIEFMGKKIFDDPCKKAPFEKVFYDILPNAVSNNSPWIPYWPSSPHNPSGYENGHNSEKGGDSHYWDVWHGRKPIKSHEQTRYRFVSEYGMQSYPSPETVKTFAPLADCNVFGPIMENHQKNGAGNSIIMDYLSRLYRFPKDYSMLAYLSQLNQAYCIKTAVEHHRRSMPQTMGSLFWQLNDCWPVASWSSIEFTGQWKALHYAARRFFAPVAVSAFVNGDEASGRSNMIINTMNTADIYTVYDLKEPMTAVLGWELYNIQEKMLISKGSKNITLKYGEARCHENIDFTKTLEAVGRSNVALRIFVMSNDQCIAQNTVLFTAPRFIDFNESRIVPRISSANGKLFRLKFSPKHFYYQVMISCKGEIIQASDNYFDLFPGIGYDVEITTKKKMTVEEFKSKLSISSIADSY